MERYILLSIASVTIMVILKAKVMTVVINFRSWIMMMTMLIFVIKDSFLSLLLTVMQKSLKLNLLRTVLVPNDVNKATLEARLRLRYCFQMKF